MEKELLLAIVWLRRRKGCRVTDTRALKDPDHRDNLVSFDMQDKEELEEARESCIPQHASLMLAVGLMQSLSNAAACLAVMLCLRIEVDLLHCLLGVGRKEPEVVMLALAGHTKTNWMIAPQLHQSTACLTPCELHQEIFRYTDCSSWCASWKALFFVCSYVLPHMEELAINTSFQGGKIK